MSSKITMGEELPTWTWPRRFDSDVINILEEPMTEVLCEGCSRPLANIPSSIEIIFNPQQISIKCNCGTKWRCAHLTIASKHVGERIATGCCSSG
jgi:hypothetical protein